MQVRGNEAELTGERDELMKEREQHMRIIEALHTERHRQSMTLSAGEVTPPSAPWSPQGPISKRRHNRGHRRRSSRGNDGHDSVGPSDASYDSERDGSPGSVDRVHVVDHVAAGGGGGGGVPAPGMHGMHSFGLSGIEPVRTPSRGRLQRSASARDGHDVSFVASPPLRVGHISRSSSWHPKSPNAAANAQARNGGHRRTRSRPTNRTRGTPARAEAHSQGQAASATPTGAASLASTPHLQQLLALMQHLTPVPTRGDGDRDSVGHHGGDSDHDSRGPSPLSHVEA